MVKQEEEEVDRWARKVERGRRMTPEPTGRPTYPRRTIDACTSQGHRPPTNYSSVSRRSRNNSNCLSSYRARCRCSTLLHEISHPHSRSNVVSLESLVRSHATAAAHPPPLESKPEPPSSGLLQQQQQSRVVGNGDIIEGVSSSAWL
jgi:hypothetical protein